MTPDGTSKDESMMQQIMNGSMMVDGLSISKVVAQNADYFHELQKKDCSPHRHRARSKEHTSALYRIDCATDTG